MSAWFILENLLNGIVDGNNINIFFIIILKDNTGIKLNQLIVSIIIDFISFI